MQYEYKQGVYLYVYEGAAFIGINRNSVKWIFLARIEKKETHKKTTTTKKPNKQNKKAKQLLF